MKVILLADIPNVGRAHDVREVAGGYARNFLLPKGLVELATPGNLKRLETRLKHAAAERKVQEELLEKNMESLAGLSLTLQAPANEEGHLFAGIHAEQIAEALKGSTRLDIPADLIQLEKPIKKTGQWPITVHVKEKKAEFTLTVAPTPSS